MHFSEHMFDLLRAGYPVLMIQTYEYGRAYQYLKQYCIQEDSLLFSWNCTDGLGEMGLRFESVLPVGDRIYDPSQVMEEFERRLDTRESEMFVLEGIADFINNHTVKVFLRKLAMQIPKSEGKKHLILISPLGDVPAELLRYIAVIEMPVPNYDELAEILDRAIKHAGAEVADGLRHELIKAADGLTSHEAGLAYRLAGVRDGFGHRALESVREAFQLQAKGQAQ